MTAKPRVQLRRPKVSRQRWIFLPLFCLLAISDAASQGVSLAWDPNSETNLAGYVIYYGTASGQYSNSNNVGNTTNTTVVGLREGGDYFFVVTAYDSAGLESDPSNEVNYRVPRSGPTISGLSNQSTLEDTPKVVSFTVSRGTNTAGTLSLTALSSDSALMPATNIVITGSGSNYTATLTPRANAFGLATITLVASNGTQAASNSFVLSVSPANDTPTLNPVGNLALQEDAGQQSVSLSGISSGATNENQSLTITAVSSNPALLPNPTLAYTSPNSTGTLTFRTATNASGSATITVTVSDGQGSNNVTTRAFIVSVAAVNDVPSLSIIPNQQTGLNSPTVPIPFLIQDVDSPSLAISGSSSNPTLLPATNIMFGGSGSNRTVQLAPAQGQSGQASIVVAVTDGLLTATTSFLLTVAPSNTLPTISWLSNQFTLEDSPKLVSFTVSRGTNTSGILSWTALSSDSALLRASNIVITGSGSNYTATLTPQPNASGSATVTLLLSTGTQTASSSFLLTVNPVNDAPTLSNLPDQLTGLNSPTAPIPFLIQDVDSKGLILSAISTNPTLLPATNILFGGSGSNRTVQLTPAPGQAGQASVIIAVTDGQLTNATAFMLTVTLSNAVPTITAITNQTTDFYTPLVSVPVRIGDAETPAGSLSLSATSSNPLLLPGTNITLGGSGSNRTVTITPAIGRSGTVVISLGVHDGNSIAMTSFQLTIRTPLRPLVVTKRGEGTVTPDLNGKLLTVGQAYTLTAIPAAGQVFAGWRGTLTAATAALRFTMTSNVVLEARFMTNPYTPLKGSYTALFYEADEVRHDRSGLIKLLTTSRGTYSGRLRRGSKSYSFRGRLDLGCRATNTIRRAGTNALTLEFELAGGPGGDQVSGRVTDGNWVAGLQGDRAVFHAVTNRAPFAGNYTVILPADTNAAERPDGDGYGTASVAPGGKVLLRGRAADGTPLVQKVTVSRQGVWPIYISLYGGKGSMLGWLRLTNRPNDDITGLTSWIRPTIPTARFYPGGFTNETSLIGSSYVAPASSTNRVVALTNGVVTFEGGNLSTALTNAVVLNTDNHVLNLASNRMGMTIAARSGLFSGWTMNPADGKTLTFKGALLQKSGSGSGCFRGTNQAGRVYLGPAP